MQEGGLRDMLTMQEELGHYERCGICRRRWDILSGVDIQEGVGHCKRCCICTRRWDIARGVEYAEGGGTLRSVWNRQER